MDLKQSNYHSYLQKKMFHMKFTKKFKKYVNTKHTPLETPKSSTINERENLLFLLKSFRRLKENHCCSLVFLDVPRHHVHTGNSFKNVYGKNTMISLNNMINKRKEIKADIKHQIKYNFVI